MRLLVILLIMTLSLGLSACAAPKSAEYFHRADVMNELLRLSTQDLPEDPVVRVEHVSMLGDLNTQLAYTRMLITMDWAVPDPDSGEIIEAQLRSMEDDFLDLREAKRLPEGGVRNR